MPYVWFLLICSIWGSSFILMKRAADCLSPATISAGRVAFGAIVLGVILWRRQHPLKLKKQDLLSLFAVVVTGFVLPYTIQPWLIAKHQVSAFIGMTVAFTPLLTLATAAVILGTRPTWRQAAGVSGALVCLLLLMWDGWQQQLPLLDIGFAVSVPLTYALANTWIRKHLSHVPSVELTFACLVGSFLVLLPFASLSSAPVASSGTSLTTAWLALGCLGVVGTGLATCLFLQLVLEQGPLFAAMATNIVPIGAIAWGLFDGEVITSRQICAIAGVLAMVILVQYGAAAPVSKPAVEAEPEAA